jgi:hypothetical protein
MTDVAPASAELTHKWQAHGTPNLTGTKVRAAGGYFPPIFFF